MLSITLLFFATLRDYAGTRKTRFEIEPGSRVSDLKSKLVEKFPKMEPALGTVLVSINKEFAFDHEEIPDGAEVALFPPVSGG